MGDRADTALDARLADVAAFVDFPATPPLAALVADRLRQPAGLPWRRPLGRGVALALVATLLLAAAAAAFGIAIGGLRLVFGPVSIAPAPSFAVGPGLGVQTTLAEARQQVAFTLRVPTLGQLGDPDLVYLLEPPTGGAVTLLYGPRPGFTANPTTGIGLIITEFRANIAPELFEKLIYSGVSVTATRVNGLDAWWVAGGEHFFFYRDANGNMVDSTLRLAGPTLIWEEGGVTHRVEGAPSLAAAVRVAGSLE